MRHNVFDHPNANANDWFDSPRAILEGPPLVLRSSNGHSASSGTTRYAKLRSKLHNYQHVEDARVKVQSGFAQFPSWLSHLQTPCQVHRTVPPLLPVCVT